MSGWHTTWRLQVRFPAQLFSRRPSATTHCFNQVEHDLRFSLFSWHPSNNQHQRRCPDLIYECMWGRLITTSFLSIYTLIIYTTSTYNYTNDFLFYLFRAFVGSRSAAPFASSSCHHESHKNCFNQWEEPDYSPLDRNNSPLGRNHNTCPSRWWWDCVHVRVHIYLLWGSLPWNLFVWWVN